MFGEEARVDKNLLGKSGQDEDSCQLSRVVHCSGLHHVIRITLDLAKSNVIGTLTGHD